MLLRNQIAEDAIAPQEHQTVTQLRLQDDQQSEDHGREQIVQHLSELGEVEAGDDQLSDQEQADDNQHQPADHAGAAGLAEKAQEGKNGHRQDGDLNQIAHPHQLEELAKTFPQ